VIAIAAGVVVAAVLATAGVLIATQSNAASGQSATSSTASTPPASVPSPSDPPATPPSTKPTTEKPTTTPTKVLPKALWKLDDTGLDVRKLEARLVQLGLLNKRWVDGSYGTMTRSAVRSFQTQHGLDKLGYVDQATWDKLVALTRKPTHDELYPPKPKPDDPTSAALDPRCQTGRALCIDKTSRKLRWVVDGQVLLTTDVRFGSVRTPTRMGAFQVGWKSRFHHSTLYDSDMPYAMFFSGGQAVHYSSDFAARGYAGASHGCVNVRNLTKIKWLFDQVQVGDKVIVYRS
jgi:peptidoglycan hydrolase-like protein with peptidoglycan-binding domain